jgi:hypothetical protein
VAASLYFPARPQPLYRHLYFQVLAAIILGVLVGHFFPATGERTGDQDHNRSAQPEAQCRSGNLLVGWSAI